MSKSGIVVSNVTMNMLPRYMPVSSGCEAAPGYNTWVQFFLSTSDASSLEYVLLVLDGQRLYEEYSEVESVSAAFEAVTRFATMNPKTKVYVSSIHCEDLSNPLVQEYGQLELYEARVNEIIDTLVSENANLLPFSLKRIIETLGVKEAYSKKIWYMASCPYSIKCIEAIAYEFSQKAPFRSSPRKKCLLLDLDNTLWGGVIGEDGVDGIVLSGFKEGAQYSDFQQVLKQIKDTGVILCVVSKNNPEDVYPVFDGDKMVLGKNDFAAMKINWSAKSINIEELSEELNIGLDSMVFVDDNPMERAEVSSALPMVEVPDFPGSPSSLRDFAFDLYDRFFRTDKVLAEDRSKTAMYQANAERSILRKSSIDLDSFISSLDIELAISEATHEVVPRLAQMTQKTNQFNITTIRYDEGDIVSMMDNPSFRIYYGRAKDKFGENGIVIMCIVEIHDQFAVINEFLMSCRVMGRKIEHAFLRAVEDSLFATGISAIDAEFIPTKKNAPASTFYDDYGFERVLDNDNFIYSKRSQSYPEEKLMSVSWIKKGIQ